MKHLNDELYAKIPDHTILDQGYASAAGWCDAKFNKRWNPPQDPALSKAYGKGFADAERERMMDEQFERYQNIVRTGNPELDEW